MSKRFYAVLIFIAAALCGIICAALIFSPTVFHAEGETSAVTLTPIGERCEQKQSDTVYAYLDDANSVFADASGITVAGESVTKKFASGTFIVTEKQFSADKLYTVDDKDVALYNGEIFRNGNETKLDTDLFVADFDIYTDATGSTLYAVTDAGMIIRAAVTPDGFENIAIFAIDGIDGITTSAIAVTGNTVFIAYDAPTLPKYKNAVGMLAYDVDSNTLSRVETVIPQTDAVLSLAALANNDAPSLYVLTPFDVSVYKMSTVGGIVTEDSYSVDNSAHRLINFSAYKGVDNAIYALDSLSGIIRISGDLSEFKTVIASASDINGFFNTPSAAAVKHSTLYVADTVNGRIAEYGNTLEYAPHEYINPVAVANDSKNTLYVAHNRSTVSLSYANGTQVDIKLPVEAGAIKQIAVNTDKTLYILADNGIYIAENCGNESTLPALKKVTGTEGYTAFALSAGQEEVYALSATNVEKLDISETDGALASTCASSVQVPNGTFSFAVDIENNVFALTASGLTRIDGKTSARTDYTFTVGTENYVVTSGQIVLNAVKNEFIRTEASDKAESETIYANAIVVDSIRHRVFVADGAAINLKLIDGNYRPSGGLPETDTTPNFGGNNDSNRIIRLALDDTPAFSLPVDMTSNYTVAKGRKVIVPVDQQNTPKEYFMILVDDVATGKLIRRYVYRDALSEPLPYSDPPEGATVATVYHNATPIYKWPSPNSPHVVGSMDKDEQLTLLKFVTTYTDVDGTTRTFVDDYGNRWYRVTVGLDKEGYVLASNVSLLDYEPTAIHPAYNAEIIEYEGEKSATVYKLDADGNFVAWTEIAALPAGTRVEVIGSFDSTLEYTQIKFFNSELNGSLTCYVRTVHIDYDGVNVVLLIAILVIVITVILIAIIIARVVYVKKKRLVNTVAEDDEQ